MYMKFSRDGFKLNDKPDHIGRDKSKTYEDYMEFYNVVVARTGLQDWAVHELVKSGAVKAGYKNLNQMIKVYRPKESFSEAVLKSFDSKPIMIGHPSRGYTSGKDNDKHHGTMSGIAYLAPNPDDEGEFLCVIPKITLWTREAIESYNKGLREVSIGYFDKNPMVWVKDKNYAAEEWLITINHLGIVEKGRGGSVCKLNNKSEGKKTMDLDIAVQKLQQDMIGVVAHVNASTKSVAELAKAIPSITDSLTSLTSKLNEKMEKDEAKEKEMEEKAKENAMEEEKKKKMEEESKKNDVFMSPLKFRNLLDMFTMEQMVVMSTPGGWMDQQTDVNIKSIYKDVYGTKSGMGLESKTNEVTAKVNVAPVVKKAFSTAEIGA